MLLHSLIPHDMPYFSRLDNCMVHIDVPEQTECMVARWTLILKFMILLANNDCRNIISNWHVS